MASGTSQAVERARGRPAVASLAPDATPGERLHPAMDALRQALNQLSAVVSRLSDEQYRAVGAACQSSSIGSHVRHCLDHVRALADGATAGRICYDARERGTDVETIRRAALDMIEALVRRLEAHRTPPMDAKLMLSAQVSASESALEFTTSWGREVAFVQSHTLHHAAMISAAARALGVETPAEFGYAPATISYQRSTCAPSPSSR